MPPKKCQRLKHVKNILWRKQICFLKTWKKLQLSLFLIIYFFLVVSIEHVAMEAWVSAKNALAYPITLKE